MRAALVAAALLLASCATPPLGPRDDELAARVDAALAQRGLERDVLQIIDNVLRHEPGPPPRAPGLVRELLARPLAAADAAQIFRRAVPPEVLEFDAPGPGAALEELLARYIAALAQAQALLREAARGARFDAAETARALQSGAEPAAYLLELARTDEALVRRAVARFTRATAQFASALRSVPFPAQAQRFDSLVGEVVIGTRGDDRHGPEAALVIDPGGNDHYERAPLSDRVAVIVDLAGDDTYRGADVVVQGLGALVDFSGNDRYEAAGPGLAAVLLGASLLVDFSGNDAYEAGVFGQGAAAYGLGALLDYEGDDTYRLGAAGQGYGLAGGVGLLWDRAGNDRYSAGGMQDVYGRGGAVSFAQGAAFGLRTMLAGGIGILRDDAGDDDYEAQMFAQGTGYYYGLGLAWDRAGNDQWRAVRYAQGNGVHEAAGVLRDERGDDRYELSYGVGQGMGLDLGVGLLSDGAGDDRYRATVYAQGNATANGVGVLYDRAGADEWHMGADPRAWGDAEPARSLPSLGLLLYEEKSAAFFREGKSAAQPRGGTAVAPAQAAQRHCPPPPEAAPHEGLGFAAALRSLEFLFRGGKADAGAHAYVRRRLVHDLEHALQELPRSDFVIDWILGNVLACVLEQASPEEALAIWGAMERVLAADPASPFALAIALAARERPAPPAQLQRIARSLQGHPSCAVRAVALTLENSASAAQAALRSSCWLLQAKALELLGKLGAAPDAGVALPSFLRQR